MTLIIPPLELAKRPLISSIPSNWS